MQCIIKLKGVRTIKNIIEELSPNLNVITGANASGKTELLNYLKARNLDAEFIDNCAHDLDCSSPAEFAKDLKEKSRHKQYIVASLRKEIIDMADKLTEL